MELLIQCAEPECDVATSGVCVNGFTPSSTCPHFSQITTVGLSRDPSDITTETKPNVLVAPEPRVDSSHSTAEASVCAMLPLYSGLELSDEEAQLITQNRPTKLVVFAGMHDCGKTTLAAEIMHALQAGPLGNYLFASSRTLVAFDQRCYRSRVESGNTSPHTLRTPQGLSSPYIHLCLREGSLTNQPTDILIADLSGEEYERACSSNDAAGEIAAIKRANHLVLMFDGKKLIEPKERELARSRPLTLLRRLIELDMVGPAHHIDIVFSKWDEVQSGTPEARAFVERLMVTIDQKFRSRVGHLVRHDIAARSFHEGVPAHQGLAELVHSWMSSRELAKTKVEQPIPSSDVRSFSQFTSASKRKKNV